MTVAVIRTQREQEQLMSEEGGVVVAVGAQSLRTPQNREEREEEDNAKESRETVGGWALGVGIALGAF